MEKYDIIITGADPAGMAAGAQLAEEGKKVLIIEKSPCAGGKQAPFRRGRFEFTPYEAGPYMPFCGTDVFGNAGKAEDFINIGDDIEEDDIKPEMKIIYTEGGEKKDIVMPFGTDSFKEAAGKNFPGSSDGLDLILGLARRNTGLLTALGKCSGKKEFLRFFRDNRDFLYTASRSMEEVADAAGMHEKMKDILKLFIPPYYGTWDRLSFTDCSTELLRFIDGRPYLHGVRPGSFMSLLEKAFTDKGGEMIFNTEVTSLIAEDGKVHGVRTSTGEEFLADRVIAESNIPGRTGFMTVRKNCFRMYLGLDKTPEELKISDYSYYIIPGTEKEKKIYPYANVVCPSLVYGPSPEGTCTLVFTVFLSNETADMIRPEYRDMFCDRFSSLLADTFEKAAEINIKDSIEEAVSTFESEAVPAFPAGKKNGAAVKALSEEKTPGADCFYGDGSFFNAISSGFAAAAGQTGKEVL